MKYKVIPTNQFRKDYKKAQKQHKDLSRLQSTIAMLADGHPLPPQYRDHVLSGNYKNKRECHIEPDWLLIYEINDNDLILLLVRTGSHSELF